ncbi:OLC1v1024487C1 [Oldenlandia corymbosa var. corymbosa]|uniref:OLC1v1024487C1 n=1 Tax=Oldenlandia corymbosa var. corymbosa TaxID=529605 RepID=A0AAV1C2G0_OLDCO|nr:OLC1v1024487C1 [Oldenlandia corymbosa var. corymbosa]
MSASTIFTTSNFSSFHLPLNSHNRIPPQKHHLLNSPRLCKEIWGKNGAISTKHLQLHKFEKGRSQLKKLCCHSSLNTEQNPQEPVFENEVSSEDDKNGGEGGEERDWTSSILLSGLYAGLLYYVFILAPNQTPSTDTYFVKKLLNVIGDDGFRMNEVLVALWYIMGLFPLVYSMLLLPSARSEKGSLPVWPFLVLSFFLGAYGLIPYFILWKPPPPPVDETEIKSWPLNFLESKVTAGITLAAGLGLIVYAGLSNGDVWKEFHLYFRSSRFVSFYILGVVFNYSLLSCLR